MRINSDTPSIIIAFETSKTTVLRWFTNASISISISITSAGLSCHIRQDVLYGLIGSVCWLISLLRSLNFSKKKKIRFFNEILHRFSDQNLRRAWRYLHQIWQSDRSNFVTKYDFRQNYRWRPGFSCFGCFS